MKTLIKKSIFALFVLLLSSCSEKKNILTKEYVLEKITEMETKNPIVFKSKIPNIFIKSRDELNISIYSKLYKDGFLEAQLRTDIPNAINSYRPYKVIPTFKAEPYILKKNKMGYFVKTLEFKAAKINEIRILSDFKAEADVLFVKNKTPFHTITTKDISPNGREYNKDSVVKTISFRKNKDINEWFLPAKIRF